jgi:hypothetical protein
MSAGRGRRTFARFTQPMRRVVIGARGTADVPEAAGIVRAGRDGSGSSAAGFFPRATAGK